MLLAGLLMMILLAAQRSDLRDLLIKVQSIIDASKSDFSKLEKRIGKQ